MFSWASLTDLVAKGTSCDDSFVQVDPTTPVHLWKQSPCGSIQAHLAARGARRDQWWGKKLSALAKQSSAVSGVRVRAIADHAVFSWPVALGSHLQFFKGSNAHSQDFHPGASPQWGRRGCSSHKKSTDNKICHQKAFRVYMQCVKTCLHHLLVTES